MFLGMRSKNRGSFISVQVVGSPNLYPFWLSVKNLGVSLFRTCLRVSNIFAFSR